MSDPLNALFRFIREHNGISKGRLITIVSNTFCLIKDRSVYYCADFAIRFSHSQSQSKNFNNTVLALSMLQKYDERPFIVCLVTPNENFCFIANTTFLKRISHSSQELRKNNIRGSFNGSDIVRKFNDIENNYENIRRLFTIHEGIDFEDNLQRLVEATNNISLSNTRFNINDNVRTTILNAPKRAIHFTESPDFGILKAELDNKVIKYKNEILLAARIIENVNIRGRVIEYLIAGDDESIRESLIEAIQSRENRLPSFPNNHSLGDYQRRFDNFDTETDVKTKMMIYNSNPKGYNLDKMLKFLSDEKSVFMFYFVGIDLSNCTVNTVLVSIFQENLIGNGRIVSHWSGRNSRGVLQLDGTIIKNLIKNSNYQIVELNAHNFLKEMIDLRNTNI